MVGLSVARVFNPCRGAWARVENPCYKKASTRKYMSPQELRKRLSGVIAFPVTPFKSDLSLDRDGLRKNLRSLLKHPICAVVAAAGTGEFHSLSLAEHEAVVRATLQEVDGKVPVLAGV